MAFTLISRNDVGEVLKKWLIAATDGQVTIYLAERELDPDPVLGLPYLTLKFGVTRYIGRTTSTMNDEDNPVSGPGTIDHLAEAELKATVTAYSPNGSGEGAAEEILCKALRTLDFYGVRDLFEEKSLAYRSNTGIRDLTDKYETGWEGRAQTDVVFGIAEMVSEPMDFITSAEVKLKE